MYSFAGGRDGLIMKIPKRLCCLDRQDIEKNLDELAEIISPAKHICRKCARVSSKKKYLCKPVKLNPAK